MREFDTILHEKQFLLKYVDKQCGIPKEKKKVFHVKCSETDIHEGFGFKNVSSLTNLPAAISIDFSKKIHLWIFRKDILKKRVFFLPDITKYATYHTSALRE